MSCTTNTALTTYLFDPATSTTQPVPPTCADPEPCGYVQDAACVAYTGTTSLSIINVVTGTRLSTALKNINDTIGSSTQAISIEDSDTVDLSANGTTATPLKAEVKISAIPKNPIKKQSDGIYVLVDETFVQTILTLIKDTPTLKEYFCTQLVGTCGDFVCGTISALSGS